MSINSNLKQEKYTTDPKISSDLKSTTHVTSFKVLLEYENFLDDVIFLKYS